MLCRYELQQKSIFHFFNINEIIGQGMKIQIFLGNIDLSTKMRKSDRMIYIRSIFVSVTNSMKWKSCKMCNFFKTCRRCIKSFLKMSSWQHWFLIQSWKYINIKQKKTKFILFRSIQITCFMQRFFLGNKGSLFFYMLC